MATDILLGQNMSQRIKYFKKYEYLESQKASLCKVFENLQQKVSISHELTDKFDNN